MLMIVAIAVCAGLVWAALYLERGSLALGCVALLAVGYCFGHHFLNFDLGPLPLTIDRLMVAGLVVVYLVQRRLGVLRPRPLCWVDLALVGLAAVLAISTFTHDWHLDSPEKVSPLWLLVEGYLVPVVIYFLVRDSALGARTAGRVYGLLAALGVFLTVNALAEAGQQWWLVFPRYIADPELGIHFGRARGPLLQSHSLGLFLGLCLLCTWAWQKRLTPVVRFGMLIVLMPATLAALFFTYTRCAWMGAALGGLIVLGFSLRPYYRLYAIAGLLVLAGLVGTLAWDGLAGLDRQEGSLAARDSVSQRASFTYVSWKMFLDSPLWGVGFGQYPEVAQAYLSDRSTSLHLEAIRQQPDHNTLLSLLTQTGLVGLVLFLTVLFGWARAAWQMLRSPLAPYYARLQGIVMLAALGIYAGPALFFDVAYSPPDHWFLFLLGGLTMGIRLSACPVAYPAARPAARAGAFSAGASACTSPSCS